MALTKKLEDVSYTHQIIDLIRILLGSYNIGISDYYSQRIYHIFRTRPEKVRDYLGWRYQLAISYLLNERNGVTAAWDKLAFETLMRARGLPTPPLKAVYKPGGAGIEGMADLTDRAGLGAFLRTTASYPFYLKAAYSQQGKNSFACLDYDPKTDMIRMAAEEKLGVETLIERLTRADGPYFRKACGWLFQDVLRPHPAIREATGGTAISSARIVVFREENTPRISYTVWKIATGKNYNDNFSKGKSGNWVSKIDTASGTVIEPKCAAWPHAADPAFKAHPIARLDGFILPDWELAKECVKTASSSFPLMKIQHWDLALTDKGPVLLEVNDLGDLPQIHCMGIIDDGLRKTLRNISKNPVYLYARDHKSWINRI